VFRLNEGRLELLINIVYLFWVLNFITCIFPGITAGRLEWQWTKSKLSSCWCKHKGKFFSLFLDVISLTFLN